MTTVKQEFDRTELNNLKNAIAAAKWVPGNAAGNKQKWENLKEAARPVLDTWEESMDLKGDDDISMEIYERSKTVKTVEVDQLAGYLLAKYIEKCTEYCEL